MTTCIKSDSGPSLATPNHTERQRAYRETVSGDHESILCRATGRGDTMSDQGRDPVWRFGVYRCPRALRDLARGPMRNRRGPICAVGNRCHGG